MKVTLLFLSVITICGSLSKRPLEILPCNNKIEARLFRNGKYLRTIVSRTGKGLYIKTNQTWVYQGKFYYADSLDIRQFTQNN